MPTAAATARDGRFGLTKPSIRAREHEPGHRSEHDLHRCARLAPQRRAPSERAGVDDRPPQPQPGRAADRDAAELEQAVGQHEPQQLVERAALDREPEERADEPAIEDRHRRAAEPEQHAAGHDEERHADVVRVDLAREGRLLAGRQPSPAPRLRSLVELPGHDPEGGRRVVDRPRRSERHGDEQQRQPRQQRGAALPEPVPVAGGQEGQQRPAARLGRVDGLAGVGDEALEPPRDRMPGIQPACEREVRRGRAVAAAEPQQRLRCEPLRPRAGGADEPLQLLPAWLPLAREAVNIHRREGV